MTDQYANEYVYLDLLKDILQNGTKNADRTGVGTISVIGRQVRFSLKDYFPLLTTKTVAWKNVVAELLWFIEGSGDERRLAEIRYGKPREELTDKTTIWLENADSPYWKPKANFEGDLGRVYGKQWRDWRSIDSHIPDSSQNLRIMNSTDQLTDLITGIKKDPLGRRHILTAWNPGELGQMALPPCHVMSQFLVRNGVLSCIMTQRSVDTFLGFPFNIASYALLTKMIAHVCNLRSGDLIISTGDTHIYLNHLDQVKEQLERTPRAAPTISLNKDIMNITQFTMDDIHLHGYDPLSPIKAPMAV